MMAVSAPHSSSADFDIPQNRGRCVWTASPRLGHSCCCWPMLAEDLTACCGLLAQQGRPVLDQRERRGNVPAASIDEKPLPVGGHVPAAPLVGGSAGNGRLEQGLGNAGLERSAERHIHTHKLAVTREIQQFFTVAPPARLVAATIGDGNPKGGRREGGNVYFVPAGFVRHVSDKASIGREFTFAFVRRCLRERTRLSRGVSSLPGK